VSHPPSALLSALHGSDPILSAEAARLIGDWNLAQHSGVLLDHLRTSRSYGKVTSLYALEKLAPEGLDDCLLGLLENPNVPDDFYWYCHRGLRAAAAIALLRRGNSTGLPWLRKLAEEKDDVALRWFAPSLLRLPRPSPLADLLTLEHLCNRQKRETLESISYSDSAMLCLLCEALALVDDPGADEHLEYYLNFYSRFVRGQACRSLFQRHPDAATLAKIREATGRYGTDFDRVVAASLAGASGELKDLARNARASFDRACAVDGLAGIPGSDSGDALTHAFRDPDAYVRQCAVEGAGRLGLENFRILLDALPERETDPRVLCALEAVHQGGKN